MEMQKNQVTTLSCWNKPVNASCFVNMLHVYHPEASNVFSRGHAAFRSTCDTDNCLYLYQVIVIFLRKCSKEFLVDFVINACSLLYEN